MMEINGLKITNDGLSVNFEARTCEQYVLQQLYSLQERYDTLQKLSDGLKKDYQFYDRVLAAISDKVTISEGKYTGKKFLEFSFVISEDDDMFDDVRHALKIKIDAEYCDEIGEES